MCETSSVYLYICCALERYALGRFSYSYLYFKMKHFLVAYVDFKKQACFNQVLLYTASSVVSRSVCILAHTDLIVFIVHGIS